MKALIHRMEPVAWGLFVTGTFISALLLPGYLLVVTIAAPLGWTEGLDYARAHDLASHLLGRLFLLALIVCCLWNGAHHLRHFNIDMGGLSRDTAVATLLYAIALGGSLLALVAVLRL